MAFKIFQNGKSPFQAIKTRSSKERKIDIFQRGEPMVLVQKWPFFYVFYIGHIGQGKVFYDICGRENAFLGFKDKTFKKSKEIERVLGCVVLGKNNFFSIFLFQAIQARKICFTIFQNKETLFQAIKTSSLKSRKIEIFPNVLIQGFGQKLFFFRLLILGHIEQKKPFKAKKVE